MSKSGSLVSVGLPVYNGAPAIADAIAAVLAQTHEQLELVISDNASTDETRDICEEIAKTDKRVRFSRNEVNEGATANFNKVFTLSTGGYFKWLGHDDFLDPSALELAVGEIESRPDTSIVHWLERMVYDNGDVLREYTANQGFQIDGETAGSRFRQMLLWRHHGFGGDPFFGLIRREALEATRLQGRGINPNYLLMQELSLTGKFYTIPEVLAVRIYNDVRVTAPGMIRWLDPSGTVGYPHFRKAREYFRVGLRHGTMSFADRMVTALTLVGYYLHPRELKGLAWDLTRGRRDA